MGMAASQARFLGLTARKTNVEYEGQQVNQQRTALSNQSANYYNQLLGMTVPVPPSVNDYTTTVYTFDDGSLSNSITSLIANGDGTYKVSYLKTWQDDFAAVSAGSSIVSYDKTGGTYSIGGNILRELGDLAADGSYTGTDPYIQSLSTEQRKQLKVEEEAALEKLKEQFGEEDWFVRYVKNTSTGAYEARFYKQSEVRDKNDGGSCIYDDNTGSSQTYIAAYKIGVANRQEEMKNLPARLEQDSTGRLINISFLDENGEVKETYALTTNTTTDQAAYDDAMNQYEYDKYQYDQSVQEINAKIEITQAEDKNLELRLKQNRMLFRRKWMLFRRLSRRTSNLLSKPSVKIKRYNMPDTVSRFIAEHTCLIFQRLFNTVSLEILHKFYFKNFIFSLSFFLFKPSFRTVFIINQGVNQRAALLYRLPALDFPHRISDK